MDILLNVFLPVSLAMIMLSLGIGLTLTDFRGVAERGRAFTQGALLQILLVPLVAYLTIILFELSGEIAAGVMHLAFCPGGVTSNILTRLVNGDVALSVSLTALTSLLSILTLPVFLVWSVVYFMGADTPDASVTSLAGTMFVITTLPIAIEMSIRSFAPRLAARIEPTLTRLAGVLFVLIILAALISNWGLFFERIGVLGPALATMGLIMMSAALGLAACAGLTLGECRTLTVEAGLQNGTVGVTPAPFIIAGSTAVPGIGLPAAVCGILMYAVALPLLWFLPRDS